MKKKIYLSLFLLGAAFTGHSQGSGIYGTLQTFAGGYYGAFGQVTFSAGYIVTPRATPATSSAYFTSAATHTGASNTSHVNGYAEKEGTAAFVFPVGNGTKLRTAGISAPASSAKFQAAYWLGSPAAAALPAGAPFLLAAANLGTGVAAVSAIEYWDVNGALPVNLTLSWDAASSLNTLTASTLANLIVVGYNPTTSKWVSLGAAGGTTGTLAATGTITASAVTPNTYSAFTFGSAVVSVPDLRPLYVMSDVGFSKPSALSKSSILRIYNVGDAASVATGLMTVYIYPPSNLFTIALGTSPGWSLTFNATDNYYTLTSTATTISYGALNFKPVNLVFKAAPTISNGKYAFNFEIGDGSGIEINNLNNSVPIEVTVSGL